MNEAMLIPVKAFHRAKVRLRGQIPDPDRVALARWMADGVLSAVAEQPTFIACDDETVAAWARERGATVLWGPGLGLNGAIDAGVAELAAAGFDHVTIAHGDLPLPASLPAVAQAGTVVLVPDGRFDGTNVLSRPIDAHLPASYGTSSFPAHLGLAFATGLPVCVRRDSRLALDVDTVEDCRHPLIAPKLRQLLGHTGIGEP